MASVAHRQAALDEAPVVLSPELRHALRAATRDLHTRAWDLAQVAIDLDDCEVIAANVLVAYFAALDSEADREWLAIRDRLRHEGGAR